MRNGEITENAENANAQTGVLFAFSLFPEFEGCCGIFLSLCSVFVVQVFLPVCAFAFSAFSFFLLKFYVGYLLHK